MIEWIVMGLKCGDVTEQVIGAAIRVHRALGPGLLESVYETCLAPELVNAGLRVERQVELPVEYDTIRLDCGFRIDLLVEDQVIVELKAVEKILPIHEAQLMTYLRLARKPVGLLINFNALRLRDGILRRAN
jgi:GxxExxY protein